MVYLIVDTRTNKPVYVGNGKVQYGDGARKHKSWSRIDVHRRSIERAVTALRQSTPLTGINSLHLAMARMVLDGAIFDYRVLHETDDKVEALIKEGQSIESFRALNPDLLNVLDSTGLGTGQKMRVQRSLSDDHRQAISARMTGKKRGPYNVTPEGLVGLQQSAKNNGRQFDRKLDGLTPEQVKERYARRAEVARYLRKALKEDDTEKVAEYKAKLVTIDLEYGLTPESYQPKSYSTRPRANLTIEQERDFCTRHAGKKLAELVELYKSEFNLTITLPGVYAMVRRNGYAPVKGRTTVLTPCCAPSSDTSAAGQPVVG